MLGKWSACSHRCHNVLQIRRFRESNPVMQFEVRTSANSVADKCMRLDNDLYYEGHVCPTIRDTWGKNEQTCHVASTEIVGRPLLC